MEKKIYVIESENVGERLDSFLSDENPEKSRSGLKILIDDGKVLVNDKKVKAGYSLKINDVVCLELPDPVSSEIQPEDIKLNIVYEDDDLLVINKPQGMVVHPAISNYTGTLVNALLYHIKNLSGINGVLRPGIVHRLDKNTSGLLLVAKNDKTHISLSKQLQTKECKRFYKAIVEGIVKEDGMIQTRIGRDPKNRLKQAVLKEPNGKVAITKYKVLEQFESNTFMEFELLTGRTHQIRVHAQYIHHPIVGDDLYNSKKCKFNLNGQLLHAYKIEFTHPTKNERMAFECELPDYFEKVLKVLREN